MSASFPWRRPRHELLLLALIACVAFVPVYHAGDQDLSRLCLTQALVHGHLSNDVCLTPSFDKAFFDGHLYSDKAPGLSVAAVPAAEALRLRPVDRIHGSDAPLWGVRLLTSGIAFLLGAFLVGRIGEGLAPGRGGAALVAFALGTIFAPLAGTSFGHVPAATLALGAFALAWRRQTLLAGLVAGGALLVEYQTAAVLVILAVYVALQSTRALGRYVAGVLPGVALLLTYDALAFGSPWHLSYRYVAIKQQSSGFFGIGLPHLHSTYEVFVGSSGLLLVSPVLAAAAYGLFLLARTYPVEAIVCGAVVAFFLVLNCGYYTPYGGTLLGPRFFAPALPFLAFGFGPAFARRPRLTGALTVLSVLPVLGLTIVWSQNPLLHQTIWGELVRLPSQGRESRLMRHMTDTVFKWISAGSGWGFAVIVLAGAAALALALPSRWDLRRDARRHPWRAGAIAVAAIALLTGAEYVAAKPTVLSTSISATTSAAFPGDEVDFTVTVVNETGTYLPHAALMIRLPPGMQLLGRPTFERGHGCTGTSALVCGLSFMEAHMVAREHLGVRIEPGTASSLKMTAWGVAAEAVGPKASFAVAVGST